MSDSLSTCIFCDRITKSQTIAESDLAVAFPDAFPLSAGHTLIVPRRHAADYFALTEQEQAAVWKLALDVRERLHREHPADGYNVGINVGSAAGQTIMHAHLHIIPRYRGDVRDPRGGIRLIMPQNARYWEMK